MTKTAENPMKIKAIAPWFGGKRTLAPEIVQELGPHSAYWEPCCGSLSLLFAKAQVSSETVCDLHGPVMNLARVIASDDGPKLFEKLSRTMFCEPLVAEAKQRMREGELSEFDLAYWFFIESWMGRNGVAGTRQSNTAFCVRYTSNGGDPAVRFRAAAESIPAWAKRLMGVTVLTRDCFDVLGRIEDKDGTVVYVDPPYLVKGAKYVHDFQSEDHTRLAELLGRFKRTRVVVSYYDDPRLDDLYPDWNKRHLKATKAMVNQGMRDKSGSTAAPEVLLMNGPSLVNNTGGSLFG